MLLRTCSVACEAELVALAMMPTPLSIAVTDEAASCMVDEISEVAADCCSTAAATDEMLLVILTCPRIFGPEVA
jgi:hypothetical protein